MNHTIYVLLRHILRHYDLFMWEKVIKAIPVFVSSMFKFILGPVGGFVAGLHPVVTILATVGGMMFSVFIFSFFGSWLKPRIIRLFSISEKKFSITNRRYVKIWKMYGMVGIATLTPLLLTPIIGTLLAVSFGRKKNKIILYMLVSACVWAIVLTSVIYIFGKSIFPDFMGI